MAGGIKLQWKDRNFSEEQHNIYRSDTPMTLGMLPTPIVTLGNNITEYIDYDVIEGNTYYYRIGAIRGNDEAVSDELEIIAEEFDDLVLATVFNNNEFGLWIDTDDISTLFTDVNMTQPVLKDGDVVAAIMDKSGNGQHLIQSDQSRRGIYKNNGNTTWIEFDGVDDYYEVISTSDNWSFLHNADYFILSKFSVVDDGSVHSLLSTYDASSANTGMSFFIDDRSSQSYDMTPRIEVARSVNRSFVIQSIYTNTTFTPNNFNIWTSKINCNAPIAADRVSSKLNGVFISEPNTSSSLSSPGLPQTTLRIGAVGSFRANLSFNKICISRYIPTTDEIVEMENFIE